MHTHTISNTHSLKAHNKGIRRMAMSPDGAVLATAADDNTIFFLARNDNDDERTEAQPAGTAEETRKDSQAYEPLGFVEVEVPVTSMDVGCRGGESLT